MVAKQFARYLLVGGLGALTHLGVLAVCVEQLGQNPIVGTSAGFICALLLQYTLNHRWTFRSTRSHASSLWRYVIVSLSGFALNTGLMAALINYLHVWYFTAQLSVIIVAPISNFILNRYWAFGVGPAKRSPITQTKKPKVKPKVKRKRGLTRRK
jgi:putative flippase GtrA